MEALEWTAAVFCLLTFGGLAGWMALDSRRERRRARLAAGLAEVYRTANRAIVTMDEETWPIVAQQPQCEFPNAATIRIPRQVVDEAVDRRHAPPSRHAAWVQEDNPNTVTVPNLLAAAVEAGDPLRLAWPAEDPDGSGLVQWSADTETPARHTSPRH